MSEVNAVLLLTSSEEILLSRQPKYVNAVFFVTSSDVSWFFSHRKMVSFGLLLMSIEVNLLV